MVLVFCSFLLALHPIHLSVTEINYSEKDKSLQITSRIFIDDLETSIRKKLTQPELDILKPSAGQTTDQLVSAYINDHFKVKLDGKSQKLNYLGHEIEDAAIICYIEIEKIKKFRTIELLNDIIQETHVDQSNLIHVTYKGPVKSLRLLRDKPADILTFESN